MSSRVLVEEPVSALTQCVWEGALHSAGIAVELQRN